ncbi:hypothetical protein [Actinoplanes sp. CA-252034]|uniref:hypothetical protein n=1 Tax=Actinoplanes sp. CA-252034 TaxID=3239906 RepID=UPI003D96C3F4
MVLSLKLTAVRSSDVASVAESVAGFAALHGVPSELVPVEAAMRRKAVIVVPPVNGWTVIGWPRFTSFPIGVSRWLSAELNTVASVVDVFDDDWSHVAISDGVVRDRYSTTPLNQVSPGTTSREANRRWGGNPRAVGVTFGVDPDPIAPYFAGVGIRLLKALWHRARPSYSGKVWPDDSFALWKVWAFVDLWRHLGITYPEPQAAEGEHRIGVAYETFDSPPLSTDSDAD